MKIPSFSCVTLLSSRWPWVSNFTKA